VFHVDSSWLRVPFTRPRALFALGNANNSSNCHKKSVMNVTSIRDKVGRSQWRSAVCSYMQAMLPANLSPVRNSSRSIPLISRTHVDQEEDEQHPQADRSAQ